MNESHHETEHRIVTRKLRSIDLVDIVTDPDQVIFRPPVGQEYAVLNVFAKGRVIEGVLTDAPDVTIDNGTTGQDIVASFAMPSTEVTERKTVLQNNLLVTNTTPLRLLKTDATDATTYLGDITVVLLRVSGSGTH